MSNQETCTLVVAGERIYKEINCVNAQELAHALQWSMIADQSLCAFADGGFLLLRQNVPSAQWLHIRAYSANGRLMHLPSLLGLAVNLSKRQYGARSYFWRRFAHWNGQGPVPGTACRRGGYGSFRDIQTHAQNRMNALVAREDGEVPARLKRRKLPTAWDDLQRRSTKTWKDQRKGRKAWQR